jgi:hypothetical protein
MRFFNWAKVFEEQPTCKDIPAKVRKTEIQYWIFLIIFVVILLQGYEQITSAPEGQLKAHCIGVVLAMAGLIGIALIKIWAHLKLMMLYMMWDQQNRIEGEMRKSKAADL